MPGNNLTNMQRASKLLHGDKDGVMRHVNKLSSEDSHDMYEVLELIGDCMKAVSDNYMAALMLLHKKANGQFAEDIGEIVKNFEANDTVSEEDFCEHVRSALVNQYSTEIRSEDDSEFTALMEDMREQLSHPPGKEKRELLDSVASRVERNFRLWGGIVKTLWEKDDNGEPEGFTAINGQRRAEAFLRAMPQKLKMLIKADGKSYGSIQEALRAAKAKTNLLSILNTRGGNTMAVSRMSRHSRSRDSTTSDGDSNTDSGSENDDEIYTHMDGASMMGSAGVKRFRNKSGGSKGTKNRRGDDKGSNRRGKKPRNGRSAAAATMVHDHSGNEQEERNGGNGLKTNAHHIAAAILDKGACFGCGEMGHWMSQCPTGKPTMAQIFPGTANGGFPAPPPYPQQMFHHQAHDAPYQHQQGGMNNGKSGNGQGQRNFQGRRTPVMCYGCGKTGHIKRNCPDRPLQVSFAPETTSSNRRSERLDKRRNERNRGREDRGRDRNR